MQPESITDKPVTRDSLEVRHMTGCWVFVEWQRKNSKKKKKKEEKVIFFPRLFY